MPLIFNSQGYWCQTYNYRNKDDNHIGFFNTVTDQEFALYPDTDRVREESASIKFGDYPAGVKM